MATKITATNFTGGELTTLIHETRTLYGIYQRVVPFITDMTNSELATELGVTDAVAGAIKTTLTNAVTTMESANLDAIRTDVYW